jgi:LCP family protein required for cell wall assembly
MLILCLAVPAGAQEAAVVPQNPIILPRDGVSYVSYPDSIVNVLFMGIDFGSEGYWGSGYKMNILQCHTDAVMVVAINLTKDKIDIVSLPRDSVTIVPGVRGVYKLNGAVNCAKTLEEGLGRTKAAVEWLLGGIKIDCYFAVDMNTMFRLGDAIGGVDFYVDMEYVGSSGKTYVEGMQHLNGTGIMDYVRARTNATVDGNDLGRARRQRDMMTAVFNRLISNRQSANNVLNVLADPKSGFFTNITSAQAVGFLALLPMLLRMDMKSFTSYSLDGKYRSAMGFNFTFTNQEHRAEVIKAVYGIDVPPVPYVSYEHTKWLMETGFASAHAIAAADELKREVQAMHLRFTEEQQQAWDAFIAAYWDAVDYFQKAADTLGVAAADKMKNTRVTLRNAGDTLAALVGYKTEIPWNYAVKYWYDDPYVNEYQLDWR